MNRDKSSLPKSRTWWCHHLSSRELSQAENKTESLAKLDFPLALPFGTAILSDTILFWFSWWIGAQLFSQKAVNNGRDNRVAMSSDYYLALCTDPKEG